MMATTEPESIPQTIRSRCQHFSFHAVKFDDIFAQLRAIAERENVVAEDAALALLAEAGDGSMRDALSIMDQAIASAPLENGRPVLQTDQIRDLMGSVPNTVFERLMESVSAQNSAQLMADLNQLISSGNSPSALARQLVRYLRNTLMSKLGGENTQLLEIAQDERARVHRTAQLFTEDDLTRNLQIALRTFDELNYRQEQRFHLELGMLKLIQSQRLLPMEEILSGLASQSGPRRTTPAPPPTPRLAPPAPRLVPPTTPSLSPFAASNQRAAEIPASNPIRNTPSASVREPEAPQGRVTGHDFSRADQANPINRALAPEGSATVSTAPATRTLETTAVAVLDPPEIDLPQVAPLHLEAHAGTIPQIAASTVAAPDGDDPIRATVVQSLIAGGHSTAATLVEDGKWTIEPSSIRIEVAAKATMIRLTFNAAAEKLIRAGLSQAGAPTRFTIVSGEALIGAGGPAKRSAPQGSIDAEARSNPLVVQAQSLFQAEIVSVIDLRT